MTRGSHVFLLGAFVLAISGCGPSAQVTTQRQEIAYQARIARITNRLARSSPDARRVVQVLPRAIEQFERVDPPAPMRQLHERLIGGLRKELAALRKATAAGADTSTIHAAVTSDARARSQVDRTLARMTQLIGACRADAANCR